jgi:hypothetical protein
MPPPRLDFTDTRKRLTLSVTMTLDEHFLSRIGRGPVGGVAYPAIFNHYRGLVDLPGGKHIAKMVDNHWLMLYRVSKQDVRPHPLGPSSFLPYPCSELQLPQSPSGVLAIVLLASYGVDTYILPCPALSLHFLSLQRYRESRGRHLRHQSQHYRRRAAQREPSHRHEMISRLRSGSPWVQGRV